MKTKTSQFLIFTAAALFAAATSNASTESGLLARYGFTTNMSVFVFDNANVQLNNGSSITGVIGISNNTGVAQLELNDGSSITTLIRPSTGNLHLQALNGSKINHISSANLTSDVASAKSAAARFASMAANSKVKGNKINLNDASMTLKAAGSSTDVFHLGKIDLNNDSTLTLNGGANAKFIIDCTQLELNNDSHIDLTGGVTPSDVVFNVEGGRIGTGAPVMGRGIVVLDNGSGLEGTVLALNGSVSMNNGSNTIVGAVICSHLRLNNGSTIVSREF